MKIYGDLKSGNCYKVKLLCSLLNIAHEWVDIDILAGETKTPDFIAKNPNAKIPLLELDDGNVLIESNAIINYLAAGSRLIPSDRLENAKVQQWQFFEQYSHEPFIAVARFIAKYLGLPQERLAEYKAKQEGGHKALAIMEQQLKVTPFLLGKHITTADISLYAYTHVANEGGFDLSIYPAINAWFERIKSQENYIAMPK
ncbi:glutathione S-transferase family protein [Litorilituus lipolyticus]|uniref:Glutathione S-transferase family protein n=1 Tax=Litorilituus lipolyticus TaxID=2491017 RepID=A0A502L4G8_9GAMM|nr:glutathione S-transferase family protein [Litorilituus lipolyticus]TPH17325.1 glutathione S-transferase family protein [Litorilituus lipolyticus]